jgi:integrase
VIGKGNRERSVPLMPAARRAVGQGDIGHVFRYSHHKDMITKDFKAICRACGIEDVHFHNLRHTAATDKLRSGLRIEYVQKILSNRGQ